jgi:glycosyltransferase involved in cell wall biosynthesis
VHKPTVLAVNNYHYPRAGAEVIFLEQNRMLAARGWEVVPFCMRHERNLPTPWDKYFVDEFEFGNAYSPSERAVHATRIIWSRHARQRIRELLAEARPDVCMVHNVYHHISPSVLGALAEHGKPVFMTLHDLKVACPAYKMLASDGICERCRGGKLINVVRHRCIKGSLAYSALIYLEATLHRVLDTYQSNVDTFVVPSRFLIDKMAEWGIDAARMTHVPNFVHLGDFQPVNKAGRHVLYFGRLSVEKGIHTLVRAAARADVALDIVGSGPDETGLKELARDLGVNARFHGYQTGEALWGFVRGARAVVLPSEWYENAPVSVLEAYALGIPVIGANIGGIPEMIEPGRTGAIFESGDIDGLARQLRHFDDMEDHEIRVLGQAGRHLVESRFSDEAHANRIESLFAAAGVDAPTRAAG